MEITQMVAIQIISDHDVFRYEENCQFNKQVLVYESTAK